MFKHVKILNINSSSLLKVTLLLYCIATVAVQCSTTSSANSDETPRRKRSKYYDIYPEEAYDADERVELGLYDGRRRGEHLNTALANVADTSWLLSFDWIWLRSEYLLIYAFLALMIVITALFGCVHATSKAAPERAYPSKPEQPKRRSKSPKRRSKFRSKQRVVAVALSNVDVVRSQALVRTDLLNRHACTQCKRSFRTIEGLSDHTRDTHGTLGSALDNVSQQHLKVYQSQFQLRVEEEKTRRAELNLRREEMRLRASQFAHNGDSLASVGAFGVNSELWYHAKQSARIAFVSSMCAFVYFMSADAVWRLISTNVIAPLYCLVHSYLLTSVEGSTDLHRYCAEASTAFTYVPHSSLSSLLDMVSPSTYIEQVTNWMKSFVLLGAILVFLRLFTGVVSMVSAIDPLLLLIASILFVALKTTLFLLWGLLFAFELCSLLALVVATRQFGALHRSVLMPISIYVWQCCGGAIVGTWMALQSRVEYA